MPRILIVDGDPGSLESLGQALAAEGLEVVAAGDPAGAWDAFLAFAPRVAVLGRRLPGAAAEALASRLQEADPGLLVLGAAEAPSDLARRLRIRLGAPAPRRAPPSESATGPGTARVLARPPVEHGLVGFGTLADLLARLWRSAADGIVEIDRPVGASLVFLVRGAPVALSPDGTAGDLRRGLATLCAATDGTFAFHPGADFSREIPTRRVPAFAPLLDGLRAAADEASFADALAAVAHAVPVRASGFTSMLPELDLGPGDVAAVEALDSGHPVGHLVASVPGAASLVWFLARAGGVELRAPAEDRPAVDEPAAWLAAPRA